MPKDREIPRNPNTPELSKEAVELLTELCFRPDDNIEQVDLLFVFGGSIVNEIKLAVENLLELGITKKVFVSGGLPHKILTDAKIFDTPESSRILEVIDRNKFKEICFFQETESTNTLENITEALKAYDFSKIKKMMILCKSHHTGRAYLITKTFLPKVEILIKTFPCVYSKDDEEVVVVDKNTWFQADFTRARIWGEFLRIKTYGGRGDFDISPVVDIVNKIDRITSN